MEDHTAKLALRCALNSAVGDVPTFFPLILRPTHEAKELTCHVTDITPTAAAPTGRVSSSPSSRASCAHSSKKIEVSKQLQHPSISPFARISVNSGQRTTTMSLIVAIFALVFITRLISWIGQSVLLESAYALYIRLFHASTAARQRQLKTELLNTKAELLKTSAQDQFAKWAKLRRSVDKGLVDLEKLNSEISANKTSFSLKFNSAIWFLTTGLQLLVGWWYRKAAVFYLPPGWFGPLGWWLAFPFAPTGSVSVGVWQMACKRVIKIGERVVREFAATSSATSTTEVQADSASEKKKS